FVILHNQHPVSLYDGTFVRKIQRNDGNVVDVDVLPDIKLGPVRQREYTDTFPISALCVVEPPQFRTLLLWVPAVLCSAERKDSLLGSAFLLVSSSAAECRIEPILVEDLP